MGQFLADFPILLNCHPADISVSAKREKRAVPFIVTSCVREVERRGISEVGIYRVSGSAVDVAKLKKAYESNPYEAEQMLKGRYIYDVRKMFGLVVPLSPFVLTLCAETPQNWGLF